MSLNSVNTNVGAMIALESLNKTNADLATAQKQVSTGYRVADSTDDGAAYAIAQPSADAPTAAARLVKALSAGGKGGESG